jgi:hypothetical protein
LQLALLDQLHAGGARDRLGHRRDPEHTVRGDRGPECALVDDALAAMATTPGTVRALTAWRSA